MGLYVNVRVKALIFDIDGTLGDTMPVHLRAWEATGQVHGFIYPSELFYQYAGLPTKNIVQMLNERFGHQLDPEQVMATKNEAYLRMIHEIKPIKPVIEIVKKFYGKLPMGLGTGEVRSIAQQNIKALGLEGYFTAMVSGDEVVNPKPDPETFYRCADRLGMASEYCQVFEDGELGLEAARRAGMIATDIRPFLEAAAIEPVDEQPKRKIS